MVNGWVTEGRTSPHSLALGLRRTVSRTPNFRGRHPCRQVPFPTPEAVRDLKTAKDALGGPKTMPGLCLAVKRYGLSWRRAGKRRAGLDSNQHQLLSQPPLPIGVHRALQTTGPPTRLPGNPAWRSDLSVVLRPGEYYRVTSARPKYHFDPGFGRRKDRWPQPFLGSPMVT